MHYRILLLIATVLLLAGCAPKTTEVVVIPEPLEDIRQAEPVKATNGSLWTNRSDSLFADHKARTVGDIVTIVIAERASATREASTSSGRDSSYAAGIPNLFGLENHDFIVESNMDMSNMLNANFTNSFEGSGKTERSGDLNASLSAQIIDVYPNGNYKIRGGKEVMVNSEVQIIYLSGIVRPVDITAKNTIDSNKILNARISYTGRGPIADKQEPGWLGRTIDHIWPF